MAKVKVGVIGTGSMGRNHVRAYSILRNLCELVGVYDIDQDRARKVAAEFDTRPFADYKALLENCEAVCIAVPTSLHYQYAVECLHAGKHILIEKPITQTTGEAKEIIALAKAKALVLQVGHIERFNPAILELPKILTGQKVVGIDIRRFSPFDPRINDADVIQDLMIHDIDIVKSLVPFRVKKLAAVGNCLKSRHKVDYAVATILTTDNVIINLAASRVSEQRLRKLQINTTEAYVDLDYMERKITVYRRKNISFSDADIPPYQQENIIEKVFVPNQEPIIAQAQYFLNSISGQVMPRVTGEDGLEALEIIEQIRECVYSES